MKKFFILLLLIVAGIGFYLWSRPATPTEPNNTTTNKGTNFEPDPSAGTFTFDDETVTLLNGRAESSDTVGLVTTTELLKEKAYGDINGDGKNDVVVLVSRSGGGSGVFIYAVAYVSGPVSYKGTNAIFLGDRVAPQSVSITNSAAIVRYLDRKVDEPYSAEPTVSVTKQLVYKNGEFVEK